MGEFQNDLAFAKVHEERFYRLAQRHCETKHVHDVSNHGSWQLRGADFIWERASGVKVPIEVKTSRTYRGVLYLETVGNTTSGTPGWFKTSEAAYVAAGFADREIWYVYSLDQMRKFVNGRRLRRIYTETTEYGKPAYRSECHILPLDLDGLFPRIICTCVTAFRTPGEGPSTQSFFYGPRKTEWGSGRVVAADSERFVAQFENLEEPVTLAMKAFDAKYILCAETNALLTRDFVVDNWARPTSRRRR